MSTSGSEASSATRYGADDAFGKLPERARALTHQTVDEGLIQQSPTVTPGRAPSADIGDEAGVTELVEVILDVLAGGIGPLSEV